MSTYVVGDIQGCLQPLKCLLTEVDFTPGQDVLWSVGDIVNRGPQCLKTLRFLYSMRDRPGAGAGQSRPAPAGVRRRGAHPAARTRWMRFCRHRTGKNCWTGWRTSPAHHHEHGHTMVHAGIPPQWSLQQAISYAREVEADAAQPRLRRVPGQMYGNEPACWSEDLTGMTRLRVITNYLTRMRYCTRDGALDLESKGPSPDRDKREESVRLVQPQQIAKPPIRILFGHWASIAGQTDTPMPSAWTPAASGTAPCPSINWKAANGPAARARDGECQDYRPRHPAP